VIACIKAQIQRKSIEKPLVLNVPQVYQNPLARTNAKAIDLAPRCVPSVSNILLVSPLIRENKQLRSRVGGFAFVV